MGMGRFTFTKCADLARKVLSQIKSSCFLDIYIYIIYICWI
jgi:hypothetical protein